MKESFVANLKDRSEKEVWFVVISFDFVTLISCFLLILLHDCFLANLRVIPVTASCSSLGTRLFKMSFAYRDLLHFSDYFVILVCNNYYFSFYVIPTNKLMKKWRVSVKLVSTETTSRVANLNRVIERKKHSRLFAHWVKSLRGITCRECE